jgi:hypothetical protein
MRLILSNAETEFVNILFVGLKHKINLQKYIQKINKTFTLKYLYWLKCKII